MAKSHPKKLHDKFKQNINNFACQNNHQVSEQKLNDWWFSNIVWLVMLKNLFHTMADQIDKFEKIVKSNNNSTTELLELSKSIIMNIYAYREKLYRLLFYYGY